LIESSKTNSQNNNEIKRKADKISKNQRTFPLVIFWTTMQTAVPKKIRTADGHQDKQIMELPFHKRLATRHWREEQKL